MIDSFSNDQNAARRSLACNRPAGPGSPRRFALLSDSFPPHAGGSRIYYYNLYKRLAEQFGHSVVVVTSKLPGSKEFDRHESSLNFRILRHSSPLPDWKYNQLPRLLPRLARDWRWAQSANIDLLHVGDLFPQGITAMLARKALGKPYLVFAHGEEITQTDRYRLQPGVRNRIYRHAHAVIAANPFARKHLLRIGVDANKIEMICPGIDSVRFAPRPPRPDLVERYHLRGRTIVLSVGRLVPHKGHSVLLHAIAALSVTSRPIHYLLAGQGPEESALRAQVHALGLGSRVTFLGPVSDAELPDIYNLCDVFALGNREIRGEQEGFGMVFLEAAASGKPVLAGRTGGTAGAVLHAKTGLLFDPEDPQDAVLSLSRLLTDTQMRETLGRTGRAWVTSRFCWDQSAAQLDKVCHTILQDVAGSHTSRTRKSSFAQNITIRTLPAEPSFANLDNQPGVSSSHASSPVKAI